MRVGTCPKCENTHNLAIKCEDTRPLIEVIGKKKYYEIFPKNRELVLRRAVLDCNYKFPENLKSSGVMFYEGENITQAEFKKLAKEMK